MPTSTFFNLTEEKKKKIIEAAKKEFLEHSFYDASINRIIKDAGISRGAFYMYFQNKEDIFIYIISGYAGELAFNVVKGTNKEDNNIFDFSLMVFDYLTNDKIEKETKEIVELILTKIDINLINHFILLV